MPRPRSVISCLRRRRWRVADAQAVLSALEASGLTVSAFAEREGLEKERLNRWRRRFAREHEAGTGSLPTRPGLIELRSTAAASAPRSAGRTEPVEIVLGSGLVVRVAETIDPATLARLVAALERGC